MKGIKGLLMVVPLTILLGCGAGDEQKELAKILPECYS